MSKKYFSSNLIKFILVTAASLLLIFFNPQGIFNPVRNVFFQVARPFQKTFYLLSRGGAETLDFLGSISELKKENENLLKEVGVLAYKTAELDEIKKENELLRNQLTLAPREKFDLEAGFVIGQDPQRQGSWIIIDKGSGTGLFPGMPVIVSEGILVGKVEEVYAGTAKVSLLTDSTSAINSLDLETGAKGIVNGEYGLGIVMNMVAQADILNEGDTIITSGLGGNMPRGLLIGKIQEVRPSGDKLFQQATIIPKFKYSKLDVVFVIKN